jgi:hypothetical protein
MGNYPRKLIKIQNDPAINCYCFFNTYEEISKQKEIL